VTSFLLIRRFARVTSAAGLAILAVAAVPSVCSAQAVAGSALKAAFTLNFIKFTEWPGLEPALPIRVCVWKDESVAAAMTLAMSGQTVGGHAIDVIRISPDGAVRGCHLLFITERDPRERRTIIDHASEFAVLTVGDADQSAKHGAIIEFFLEGAHLKFAINIDELARSGLRISSRLMALAKIVRNTDAR
jgi:hypothetical protein